MGSRSSSSSVNYDYSGAKEHQARQDEASNLRGAKFAAMYAGDIPGAIAAGGRIRDLVKAIRAHNPGATEEDPIVSVNPLQRIDSMSGSSSISADGRGPIWGPVEPQAPKPPQVAKPANEKPKPQEKPKEDKPAA